MTEIKRLKIYSLVKVLGVMYFILGLALAFLLAVLAIVGGAPEAAGEGVPVVPYVIALFVLAPVGYGLLGVLMGAFTGFFYNLAAKWVGGIEFE